MRAVMQWIWRAVEYVHEEPWRKPSNPPTTHRLAQVQPFFKSSRICGACRLDRLIYISTSPQGRSSMVWVLVVTRFREPLVTASIGFMRDATAANACHLRPSHLTIHAPHRALHDRHRRMLRLGLTGARAVASARALQGLQRASLPRGTKVGVRVIHPQYHSISIPANRVPI